jgi:hypothetical protein
VVGPADHPAVGEPEFAAGAFDGAGDGGRAKGGRIRVDAFPLQSECMSPANALRFRAEGFFDPLPGRVVGVAYPRASLV